LKPLRQNGYAKPVVSANYTQIKDVLGVVGKEAGDKYYIEGGNPDDPGNTDMQKMIYERGKAKYGHDRLFIYWVRASIRSGSSLRPSRRPRASIPTM